MRCLRFPLVLIILAAPNIVLAASHEAGVPHWLSPPPPADLGTNPDEARREIIREKLSEVESDLEDRLGVPIDEFREMGSFEKALKLGLGMAAGPREPSEVRQPGKRLQSPVATKSRPPLLRGFTDGSVPMLISSEEILEFEFIPRDAPVVLVVVDQVEGRLLARKNFDTTDSLSIEVGGLDLASGRLVFEVIDPKTGNVLHRVRALTDR